MTAQKKLKARALQKAQKDLAKKEYRCLFPGCQSKAIQSHAQSKIHLEQISLNHQVYKIHTGFLNILKMKSESETHNIHLTSTAKASTFQGFCAKHDSKFFEPVDKLTLEEAPEIPALFHLRAQCYEYCQKRRIRDFFTLVNNNPLSLSDKYLVDTISKYSAHLRTKEAYLSDLFEWLQSDKLAMNTGYKWYKFNEWLGISTSCVIDLQTYVPEAFTILDLGTYRPSLSVYVFSDKSCTHIIFGWSKREEAYALAYLKRLSQYPSPSEAINRLVFLEMEDTSIAPELWESATDIQRDSVRMAMRHPSVREEEIVPDLIQIKTGTFS